MIGAILRAQWLSTRLFGPGSKRAGFIVSVLLAAIWYGLWTAFAFTAQALLSEIEERRTVELTVARGLMTVFLYWQIAPIVSASLGASLDLKRLLVYPVPKQKLFVVEVLLRLTTGTEMLIICAGVIVGIFRNPSFGGLGASGPLAVSFLLFICFNLLLAAGSRSLLERLFARKRMQEFMVLVFVLATAAPHVILNTRLGQALTKRWVTSEPLSLWPWAATARLALGHESFWMLALLAGWTLAALLFSRWQFERSLVYDAQAALATGLRNSQHSPLVDRLYRLPSLLLPDPIAAIVEKELRSLARTPRFRVVFFMGCIFGILVWFPMLLGPGRDSSRSVWAENLLPIVSAYGLILLGQDSYSNAFGFDRSAAQLYFAAPVPFSKTLVAKNLAAAGFALLEVAAITTLLLLLGVHISPGKVIEALFASAVMGLYLFGIGNWSSVRFPSAANPEDVAKGGSGGRHLKALLFLFYPLALSPVFLAYWGREVFESQIVFNALLAFAGILGAVVYKFSMESAVNIAQLRREAIVAELSRGGGPVVTA